MERSEPQKWQLTIQQNEGLPPGTIASGYGIREYYTIQTTSNTVNNTPNNKDNHHHEVNGKPETPQQAEPWRRIDERGQVYQGADPIETDNHRRSPTLYSQISGSAADIVSSPDKKPPPHPDTPLGNPSPPRRSIGSRTVVTEDFYNALSRHQSDPNLRSADRRSRVPVTEPPHTSGDGRKGTPLPVMTQGAGSRKTRSLPELNQTPALINQTQGIGTQTEMRGVCLPTLSTSTRLITQSASHPVKALLMKRQNTRRHVSPLYVVQQNEGSANEDDSDSDTSKHYYYGPHNERLPGPPQPPPDVQSSYQSNNTRLPYLLPPLSSGVGMPSVHQKRGRFRIRVHLEYGYIVSDRKAEKLPDSVHNELLKEYGHLPKTEVVIVKRNGNYDIHSRPQRHSTSDGFLLKQYHHSEDEEEAEDGVAFHSVRTH